MRVLSIDIGTNSTLYLVGEVSGGEVQIVERGIFSNRLGAEISSDGSIPSTVLMHNREILSKLVEKSAALGCDLIGAVGTHALRMAVNRDDFVGMGNQLGIKIDILTSMDEALLGWQGVFGKDGPRQTSALLDIGGGSTELTIGVGREIESESIPVGAVGLSRLCFEDDPPTPTQIAATKDDIDTAFRHWQKRLSADIPLTGIAGTITALIAIEKGILSYTSNIIEGVRLTSETISGWNERLLKMDFASRSEIPGMPEARAKSIHAGTLILDRLTRLFDLKQLTVSERGVLFGLALRLARYGTGTSVNSD